MIDVTFMIATNRPFTSHSIKTVESINRVNSMGYTFEILIYSTEKCEGKNVRWVEEKDCIGPLKGLNILARQAEGRYLFSLMDDCMVDNNIFQLCEILETDEMKNMHVPVTSPGHHGHPHYCVHNTNWPILGNPVLKTETLYKVLEGHLFHPGFYYHCADNWIPWFAGMKGDKPVVQTCSNLMLFDADNSKNPRKNYDIAVLKWLQENWDGTYLSGWNEDVEKAIQSGC